MTWGLSSRRTRPHPRPTVLSRYADGDLDPREREAVGAHLCDCEHCRTLLHSLSDTVAALGTLRSDAPTDIADTVIAALRAQPSVPTRSTQPELTVVVDAPGPVWGRRGTARAALRYCFSRPRLTVTLPVTILVGIVLSLVNMGGSLFAGNIDFGVCVMCATDFLVTFIALNLVLLILLWVPTRSSRTRPGRPA